MSWFGRTWFGLMVTFIYSNHSNQTNTNSINKTSSIHPVRQTERECWCLNTETHLNKWQLWIKHMMMMMMKRDKITSFWCYTFTVYDLCKFNTEVSYSCHVSGLTSRFFCMDVVYWVQSTGNRETCPSFTCCNMSLTSQVKAFSWKWLIRFPH